MSKLISRDAFAREELHREVVDPMKAISSNGGIPSCFWCGNLNKRAKLYRYIIETDGGRKNTLTGLFCSVSCMRSYHG